ncbi:MAG: hypothetical protein J0L72_11540 [Armatimonadetes bacterium]|nr:hypothetical protein [Armatimonadota bacterium]
MREGGEGRAPFKGKFAVINQLGVFREAFGDSIYMDFAMVGFFRRYLRRKSKAATPTIWRANRADFGPDASPELWDCQVVELCKDQLQLFFRLGEPGGRTVRMRWDVTGAVANGRYAEEFSGGHWISAPIQGMVVAERENGKIISLKASFEQESGETLTISLIR